MAIKIARRKQDNRVYMERIQTLWKRIDHSEVDKQKVVSYLRGLTLGSTPGRYPEWDEELELLTEVAKCR